MNHTHNTHPQHHIASRSSRRRHAWHAAAHHAGRCGRAGPGLTRAGSALTLAANRGTLAVTPPVPAARHLAGDPADVPARSARPITEPAPDAHRSRSRCGTGGCLPLRPNPRAAAAAAAGRAPNVRGPHEAARTSSWTHRDTAARSTGPGVAASPFHTVEGGQHLRTDVAGRGQRPIRRRAVWIPRPGTPHNRRTALRRVDHAGKRHRVAGEELGYQPTLVVNCSDAVTAVASTGMAPGPRGRVIACPRATAAGPAHLRPELHGHRNVLPRCRRQPRNRSRL